MARTRADYMRALAIRERVFVRGQRVPRDIEVDEHEGSAKYFLAYYEGRLAGCSRIRFIGRKAKLERIAVLEDRRRHGIGRALTNHMVSYARRMGAREALMHAQCRAGDFYEKCGFEPQGRVFMEAGIRHRKMFMKL